MSAKSKMNVPASPTETLVTVERLAGIQNAMGKTLIYGASLPGRKYPATNTLKFEIHTSRTPYIYVRFHVETWADPTPRTFKSSWIFREHESAPHGTGNPSWASGNFPYAESRDWVLIHRCWLSQGRTIQPKLIDGAQFYDPITVYLNFVMDQNNGDPLATAGNYIKNVQVGGCDTADVPFLVTQGGGAIERVIRTNF